MTQESSPPTPYPVSLSVDYPDRELDRVSSLLRVIWAIPGIILLALLSGSGGESEEGSFSFDGSRLGMA